MKSEVHFAAEAAKRILEVYDTIPAADPRAFAAGLVEILSTYPQPVIERAASPSKGLAGAIAYPNLAKFKEKLDIWAEEWWEEQQAIKRANTPRLPEPPEDPEMKARIAKGLADLVQHLKSGFGPSTAA